MKLYSILSKSNYLLLFFFFTQICVAQNSIISGSIKGNSGESLPGVSVVVKGTTTGVASDFDGNYSITVKESSILVFRFIGYKTLEMPVTNKKILDIIMEEDVNSLDEIVIVGYGTQKKSDITGTVASLDQERLESLPNVDISQAIQGAIPGISITTVSTGAAPSNDDTSIVIRGKNSILASNGPLIVVDGVPYQGQLRDISPNDVKSLEILKMRLQQPFMDLVELMELY